jgi:dihydroxy-acid dehydratase
LSKNFSIKTIIQPKKVIHKKILKQTLAVVTDAKVSGFAKGLFAYQITPETAIGGPIALIEDDDIIEIDIKNRKLNVELSDAELEQRKRLATPKKTNWKLDFDNI